MQIFKLRPDVERYRWLAMTDEADEQVLLDLLDRPAGMAWRPLAADWIEDELNTDKPKSDFPTLGATIVFSKAAVDALLDLLIEAGELLPLDVEGETFFVYNVTRNVDALDEDHSEVMRFDSGRIMDVTRYVFVPEKLESAVIFRLPQLRGRVFVTDTFVQRVREAGLSGFGLVKVWSSEG